MNTPYYYTMRVEAIARLIESKARLDELQEYLRGKLVGLNSSDHPLIKTPIKGKRDHSHAILSFNHNAADLNGRVSFLGKFRFTELRRNPCISYKKASIPPLKLKPPLTNTTQHSPHYP
eukprot:sb/3476288/